MNLTPSVRGMQDLTPELARQFYALQEQLFQILTSYSYEAIRLPLVEHQSLFSRGVGEATDIVEKEMFQLRSRDDDGGNDAQVLRPEGTASCVRLLLEHGLIFNQQQRVYYAGPMFRYERPQKGRYREFYQIGAEVFGLAGPDIEAELLQLCQNFWRTLGIEGVVELQINNIGSAADRADYGAALVRFLDPHREDLDADSQQRLGRNPLRILDSKAERTQEILRGAPALADFVSTRSQEHFAELQRLLGTLKIPFTVNARLVRGLDYYNDTVFEWVTDQLGAQGTICAGGRYDGLVAQLGGRDTPAAGFAVGMERVQLLVDASVQSTSSPVADVYLCVMNAEHAGWCLEFARQLRAELPQLRLRVHAGAGKLNKQLKRADQCGANWALIVGASEIEQAQVTLKHLRSETAQESLGIEELVLRLRGLVQEIKSA